MWVCPGVGTAGPGPQCLPQADTGRTTARAGVPSAPGTDSSSAKVGRTPTSKPSSLGLASSSRSESCWSAPSGPCKALMAISKMRVLCPTPGQARSRPERKARDPHGRPRIPQPERKAGTPLKAGTPWKAWDPTAGGRPGTPRKARDPAARTEGLGPHGRPGTPDERKTRSSRPAWKAQQLLQGWAPNRPQSKQPRGPAPGRDPPPPGEPVTQRLELGFHCTFIPCFTPCIPERTVFSPLRVVGSDSRTPPTPLTLSFRFTDTWKQAQGLTEPRRSLPI